MSHPVFFAAAIAATATLASPAAGSPLLLVAAQARAQQRATATLSQRVTDNFNTLDTDKNGQLSLAEFRAAAPAVRANPGASAAAIQRLDTNKDGKVSADEYRRPILAGFDRVDTNKDGTISAAERTKAAAARNEGR